MMGTGTLRLSDFAKLESMHDKYLTRARSTHEANIASRHSEVMAWQQQHASAMEAAKQHVASSVTQLSACTAELQAWHFSQRAAINSSHNEVAAEADRLGRQLEAAQQAGATKLAELVANFLTERELPPGEAGLAEIQQAHTRAQANLRAEHTASLESFESQLRALPGRHAALRGAAEAAYRTGLAAQEAAFVAAMQLHDQGLAALRLQYTASEGRHREALVGVRGGHMQALASTREQYMGEAAALLEEYRSRMAELKALFMLQHEADLAEV